MNTGKKYEVTRATVVLDNMPVHTYEHLCDTVGQDEIEAYKDKIKARFGKDVERMDVDLVYKETK